MLSQDQQAFAERIRPIIDLPVCAIDTEFVWRKTYAPRIGLIQIAAPGNLTFAIDPLAVADPTPLAELLAGRQQNEGHLYYFFLKPREVAAANKGWRGPSALASH